MNGKAGLKSQVAKTCSQFLTSWKLNVTNLKLESEAEVLVGRETNLKNEQIPLKMNDGLQVCSNNQYTSLESKDTSQEEFL